MNYDHDYDSEDARSLDNIDIRYLVRLTLNAGSDADYTCADVSIMVTCGTYAGITDREMMANNVDNQMIHEDHIDNIVGPMSKEDFIEQITIKGITKSDIRSMTIEEVLLNEKPIALTIRENDRG